MTDLSENPYASRFEYLGEVGYILSVHRRDGAADFDMLFRGTVWHLHTTQGRQQDWSATAQAFEWEFIIDWRWRRDLMERLGLGTDEAVKALLVSALNAWLMRGKPAQRQVALVINQGLWR